MVTLVIERPDDMMLSGPERLFASLHGKEGSYLHDQP